MTVPNDDLYSNLNNLLDDICKFFANQDNYKTLSPAAKKQADQLILRSKTQLQEIAKVKNADNPDNGEAYVDMGPKTAKSSGDDEEAEDIYSSVLDCSVIDTNQSEQYKALPAHTVFGSIKYGTLSWRCKVIFNFEKMRRIFGGFHRNCLLLYNCDKDLKPICVIDLRFYDAKSGTIKHNNPFPLDFELFTTQLEKKHYYFMAQTHKDMLQWVSFINTAHESFSHKNPKEEEDSGSNTYEVAEKYAVDAIDTNDKDNAKEDDDDDQPIYNEVVNVNITPNPKTINQRLPDLPTRKNFKMDKPLPPLPKRSNVIAETSLTDDEPVRNSIDSINSFSDASEEENIYEKFVSKIQSH